MKRLSIKRLAKIALWAVLLPILTVGWLYTLGAVCYLVGGPSSASGVVAAGGFALATALVVWGNRRYRHFWVVASWLLVIGSQVAFVRPSNEREWLPEVARTASAEVQEGSVTIRNVRNFNYRMWDDFDPRYDDRTYDLDKLDSVDLLMCYWDGNTSIAHTMLSFGFGGEDYLCLSVEVRREKGEDWGGLPGIYRQFEIVYILADERDLIDLRISHRNEDVYLFPLVLPKHEIRQYFEHVLKRINTLNSKPEFYDTLEYNCSSSLSRMGRELWPDRPRASGLRSLLNGTTDEDAYLRGAISNELPFAELKKRSHITPAGKEHSGALDYSQRIRALLP